MRAVRPRVIRNVFKRGADGRVKIARDRREAIQMERVKARVSKPCSSYACPHHGIIDMGEEFAKITYLNQAKRIGHQYIPEVRNHHFECVPERAQPLVRFFIKS